MAESILTAGTVIADRFRLERPLGEGGMGAVWVARHLSLQIPCAVKFIRGEAAGSPELRARFEREARSAAQLRSPHVVQILDHGVWNEVPYIAMELLEGEDLAQRLVRVTRLSPRETLSIVTQVARALTKAHAAGLVHRDLKPANIFLGRDDDREIAKVLDFGIAKSNVLEGADGQTKSGSLIGTPGYMSPEQARGHKDIDHRADVWALGVITYLCLTGRCPFENEALGELLMLVITHTAPKPSEVAQVPPGLDAFWARAIAQKKADRFQSAKELAEALAVALGLSSPGDEIGHALAAPGARLDPPTPGTLALGAAKAVGPGDPTVSLGWQSVPVVTSAQTGGGIATTTLASPAGVPSKRSAWLLVAVAVSVVALGGAGAFFAFGVQRPHDPPPARALVEPAPAAHSTAGAPVVSVSTAVGSTSQGPTVPPVASTAAAPSPAASTTASAAPSQAPVVAPASAPSTQASQVAPPSAAASSQGSAARKPPGPQPPKNATKDPNGDYGI